jgi:hypothetical protein
MPRWGGGGYLSLKSKGEGGALRVRSALRDALLCAPASRLPLVALYLFATPPIWQGGQINGGIRTPCTKSM